MLYDDVYGDAHEPAGLNVKDEPTRLTATVCAEQTTKTTRSVSGRIGIP